MENMIWTFNKTAQGEQKPMPSFSFLHFLDISYTFVKMHTLKKKTSKD